MIQDTSVRIGNTIVAQICLTAIDGLHLKSSAIDKQIKRNIFLLGCSNSFLFEGLSFEGGDCKLDMLSVYFEGIQ